MMWTLTDHGLVAGGLIVNLLLFYLGFFLANNRVAGSAALQNAGRKLFENKIKQLDKNPLLRQFKNAADQGKSPLAAIIIGLLISIKNIGMTLVSYVGINVVMLPVQGVFMASLIFEMDKRGLPKNEINLVTQIQFASMNLFSLIGLWAGYHHWIVGMTLTEIWSKYWTFFGASAAVGIFLACMAASRELGFFQKHKRLIQ